MRCRELLELLEQRLLDVEPLDDRFQDQVAVANLREVIFEVADRHQHRVAGVRERGGLGLLELLERAGGERVSVASALAVGRHDVQKYDGNAGIRTVGGDAAAHDACTEHGDTADRLSHAPDHSAGRGVWSRTVRVVCPSCDVDPPVNSAAGAACASCGAPLIGVRDDLDLVGTVIDGRFEILATLGKGGMGTVYRAKQRSIGREVALKLIDRHFDNDVVAVKRFLREAKLASQLAHPNTVGVIEFGQSQDDGRLYLVMELVRGKTLHVLLQDGPFPLARVVRIGVQLCDALEAAHALAIVHRDLKLENVILLDGTADRDLVKVLDFGLARSLTDVDSRATASGLVAGTPRYLAPEVALGGAGAAPDQDMYALGVLLGELAVGGALWEAPTIEALFTQKMLGKPKLDAIDPALRVLVEQLLDSDPSVRPSARKTREILAGLEAPNRRSPVALAPTLAPLAPIAPIAPSTATGDGLDLPSAAFAPPRPSSAPLELEGAWVRAKESKIDAAKHARPPQRSLKIWGVVAAVVAVGVVTTVVVIIGTQSAGAPKPKISPENQVPATSNTVSIEVRATPAVSVTFDGHKAGRTPLTLHIQKSTREVILGGVVEGHPVTRTIVPDRDQTVELKYP